MNNRNIELHVSRHIELYVSRQLDDAIRRRYFSIIENRLNYKPLKHVYLCMTQDVIYNLATDNEISNRSSKFDLSIELLCLDMLEINRAALATKFVSMLNQQQNTMLTKIVNKLAFEEVEKVTDCIIKFCQTHISRKINDYFENECIKMLNKERRSLKYLTTVELFSKQIVNSKKLHTDFSKYCAITKVLEASCSNLTATQVNEIVDNLWLSNVLGV